MMSVIHNKAKSHICEVLVFFIGLLPGLCNINGQFSQLSMFSLKYRLWEDGWKDRYYQSKFDVGPDDIAFRHKVVSCYI